MKTSAVLRVVADTLPMTRTQWDGGTTSRFICDHLTGAFPVAAALHDRMNAKSFLLSLGMGTGHYVFGASDYFSEKEQHERRAWLLFAADVYDEWSA
jgi:hypothetical protein